jgi:hypothetical protein
VRLGDEVDSGVGRPAPWPLVPQPHFSKLAPVLRCRLQEPPTKTLELAARNIWAFAESSHQFVKGHRVSMLLSVAEFNEESETPGWDGLVHD